MSGYIKERILSGDEIKEALEIYESLSPVFWHQNYNLFDVERRDVPTPLQYGFYNTLKKYSKMPGDKGAYFLKYEKDSFTRMHEDNNSDLTIVTLLKTKELVGGESLVRAEYKLKSRPMGNQVARHSREQDAPPYGQQIIMDVVKVDDGESLVYGPNLTHGVSKVYDGHRIVLVTWFNKTENKG